MKHTKSILTAMIVGSIGLGAQPMWAQSYPETTQPEIQQPSGEPGRSGLGQETHQQPIMAPEEVKKVQEALKAQGYDPGSTDGTMDARTQQALRDFQKANDLPVTGALDAQTAEKLGVQLKGNQGSKGHESLKGQEGAIQPQGGAQQ